MTNRIRLAAIAAAAALVLTSCSPSTSTGDAPSTEIAAPAAVTADTLLAKLDLDGLTGPELVERLDASPDARPLPFSASVRPDEVLISDGTTQAAVALPQDEFYMSVAPYVSHTHDCFHHNLATCQGELVEEDVHVRVVTDDGDVLVDEVRATYANGFVGFWVPRGVAGSIEVTYGERTGSATFATGDDDPTCLTTLRLA